MPDQILDRLELAPGEHVLAWAPVRGGGAAAATTLGLWLADEGGAGRRAWSDVLHATWNPQPGALVVDVLTASGRERYRILLTEPGTLPETVRDRVTSSILFSEHVWLAPQKGVRIVARRGFDGEAAGWQLVYDDGVDSGDREIVSLAERELARLQRDTGL